MSHTANVSPLFLSRFASLRDLLDLVALLRDFREPLGSPEGLRRAIDLLLKLGQSLGIDPDLLSRLRSIADDPRVFEILLAVLRYALSVIDEASFAAIEQVESSANDATAESLGLANWFAILMQLLELLRRLQQQPMA